MRFVGRKLRGVRDEISVSFVVPTRQRVVKDHGTVGVVGDVSAIKAFGAVDAVGPIDTVSALSAVDTIDGNDVAIF